MSLAKDMSSHEAETCAKQDNVRRSPKGTKENLDAGCPSPLVGRPGHHRMLSVRLSKSNQFLSLLSASRAHRDSNYGSGRLGCGSCWCCGGQVAHTTI